ncbi:MAG: PEP-CTERM/exosortase system-associated acyltransferase [Halioglobus sp.]|nr:PEP-CTERM/exosortase system-associated acyltransferase [Halioglobus sp.]
MAEFHRYCNLELANTASQLDDVFRIRYRVYCEEFGYEAAEKHPAGLESDEFDPFSRHTLVTHAATAIPAGCARLVLADEERQLPMERFCGEAVDAALLSEFDDRRDSICEFSRLGVDSVFRRRTGEKVSRFGEIHGIDWSRLEQHKFSSQLAMATILSGLALSEVLERPHCFAMMEPFLPRLLRRSGLIVHKAGDEIDYHGLRRPYYWETREMVSGLVEELQEFYLHIREAFAEDEPVLAELNTTSAGLPDVRIGAAPLAGAS